MRIANARQISKYRGARLLDIVGAIAVLVVASPLLFAVSIAIAVDLGRPIFFRQVRPGLHGEPFTLVKFRTMREPEDESSRYFTDSIRATRLGRILRTTSIDELPSLVNVLRGEMSLVGPRPLLFEHLPHLTDETRRRLTTPPGITGLAQVSGRQDLTFSQRFTLDIKYVEERSLLLDLRILAKTALRLFSRSPGVRTGQRLDDVDDLGVFKRKGQS